MEFNVLFYLFRSLKYEEYDKSIVYFIRLVMSAYLREHSLDFEEQINILYEATTIDDYCKSVIEIPDCESDEIQVLLLPIIFNIKIHIEYLDQSTDKTLHSYDFPDNEYLKKIFSLLYRPSHYDILYE